MFKLNALAGLALAAGLMAAPAMAQDEQELIQARLTELACVELGAKSLPEEVYFGIGTLLLAEQADNPKFDEHMAHVTELAIGCATDHDWDEPRATLAIEIALQGMVLDTIAAEMGRAGMTDAQIEQLDALSLELSDEDLENLLYGAWREDESVYEGLEAQWVAAGIPSEGGFENMAPRYLETSVIIMDIIGQWMDAYLE